MRWRRQALVSLVLLASAAPVSAQAAKPGASAAAQRAKVDVNAPDAQGTPPLHWAVRLDDATKVRSLLSAGADAKLANRYGVTPLTLAVTSGNPEVIKLLLDAGADPNAVDPAAETM